MKKQELETYRGLVSDDRTMKSTDLHKFVHEATGKFLELKHFHEKIRTILDVDGLKFRPSLNANKTVAFYNLDEVECNMIMASIDVGHLRLLAEVFVTVKNAVETPKLPQTYLEAVKALAVEIEAKEKLQVENTQQATKIQSDAPKVLFSDAIECAINSCLIGTWIKAVELDKGIKIGQNKAFKWLRNNGYLIKSGRRKNNPMQQYINNGYFELKVGKVATPYGTRETFTPLITGKGQIALVSHLGGL